MWGRTPQIVFFHAHQDDETLIMGGAIRKAILEGRDVHVVQLVDGSASAARTGSLAKTLGYTPTKAAFVEHRNRERDEALALLGVPLPNRHRSPKELLWEDGTGTTAKAEAAIAYWAAKFPKATLAGHSFIDAHIDHRSIGNALDKRSNRLTKSASYTFYVNPRYLPVSGMAKETVPFPGLKSFATDAQDDELAPYWDTNLDHDRWGIGCGHSAGPLCTFVSEHKTTYWHYDSRYWASSADKKAAQAWIDSKGGYK